MSISSQNLVVKSNELVNAAYKLSLMEQKIILSAISQVDSRTSEATLINDKTTYIVRAEDLMPPGEYHEKIDISYLYKKLYTASKSLYEKSVVINHNNINRKTKFRLIQSVGYRKGKGEISFSFSTHIIPYLTELQDNFTQYRLETIAGFKSLYSIRFYEWLIQYAKIGRRTLTLREIRHALVMGDKYPKVSQFQSRVIDIALAEINQHSDIDVNYYQNKEGAKIVAFTFLITRKKQTLIKKRSIKPNRSIAQAHPGESWDGYHNRTKH